MSLIEIVKAKTIDDCKICSKFMSKLINYESVFDKSINQNVNVSELFEKNLNNEHFYFAYAKLGVPIGFIFGYLQVGKGKVRSTNILNLEGIFIEEEYRKSGAGKKLLNSFENWANKQYNNDYQIEITYINSNVNAKRFYESLGYNPVKTILRK